MVPADIEVEKIDNVTEPDPIDHVADRTARYQGQGEREYRTLPTETSLSHPDQKKSDGTGTNEKGLAPQGRLPGKNTESSTVVDQIGQIEEIGDDLPAFIQREGAKDQQLSELIGTNNAADDRDKTEHTLDHQLTDNPGTAGAEQRMIRLRAY